MSWTAVGLILILVMLMAGSKFARCSFLLFAGIAAIVALVWWIAIHHGSGPAQKHSALTFRPYAIMALVNGLGRDTLHQQNGDPAQCS
jgi:hypothetical protein